ncbi:MAG TPA: hypothetical protein EYN67_18495 [Flavobacteriales bacterium]|nr:hypothetical protein [Flavobacteriales bacterium]
MDNLIDKYLSDELSSDEELRLKSWMKKSPENELLLINLAAVIKSLHYTEGINLQEGEESEKKNQS